MGKKKKCKKVECPAGEKWAVPTADFFSLLLALFIALFAIASVNTSKINALKEEFIKIYDFAPTPEERTPIQDLAPESTKPDPDALGKPSGKLLVIQGGSIAEAEEKKKEETKDSISKIQKELLNSTMGGDGPLDQSLDGVLLKLPVSIPFRGASATIDDDEVHLFLSRIAYIINALPANADVSVRGYTDAQPLAKSSSYMDNIDLSIKRADAVMRELIKNGVSAERLSAAGFGSAKPIAENTTEENRAKNRRVELYIFISKNTPLDKAKQNNILDALSKLQK
ncbi:MAG: flagellar motor protein MotB [Sulfurimonas sp.]|jgi:chemotaxis protein MotB